MKVNEVYKCESESFPASPDALSRYVLIRAVNERFVAFSTVTDEQHYLNEGILEFGPVAKKVKRSFFGEHFILVKNARAIEPAGN